MDMSKYIKDMQYAAEKVLDGIWEDARKFEELIQKIETLERTVQATYQRAQAIADDAMDADDVMHATGMHWDNYFGDDKELFHSRNEKQDLEEELKVKELSIMQLSTSLLQFAKQGISIVHQGLQACPNGRTIGSLTLKDIIWQGRNQGIHFEEGNLNSRVKDVFQTLIREQGPQFNGFLTESRSFEVIKVLGWTDFAAFEADLQSLA